MKRIIMLLILVAALIVTAVYCDSHSREEPSGEETESVTLYTTEPSEETAEPPTTVPETEPVPETEEAAVLADSVPVILTFLNREDSVDVVKEFDEDHVEIKLEQGFGLVEKTFLRMEGAPSFETFTGYAIWNAGVYDNFYLTGEPVKTLGMNTAVEVLEDLETCWLIRVEDSLGYAAKKQINRWPISSGGGSSEEDSGGGGDAGQDGGDITMAIPVTPLSVITQEGEITGKGTVLADGTPVILGYFDRGETLPVVTDHGLSEEKEGFVIAYFDGLCGYVEENMVRKTGESAYEAWDGYAKANAKVYDNFRLTGDPYQGIWMNLKLHVVEDLGQVLLVEVNEKTGYIRKDSVSETAIPVYGGGGGDESSGGGGQEWSDPIL